MLPDLFALLCKPRLHLVDLFVWIFVDWEIEFGCESVLLVVNSGHHMLHSFDRELLSAGLHWL